MSPIILGEPLIVETVVLVFVVIFISSSEETEKHLQSSIVTASLMCLQCAVLTNYATGTIREFTPVTIGR